MVYLSYYWVEVKGIFFSSLRHTIFVGLDFNVFWLNSMLLHMHLAMCQTFVIWVESTVHAWDC